MPVLDAKGQKKSVKGRIKMETLGVKDVNRGVRVSTFRMLTVLCEINPHVLLTNIDDLCYAMLLTGKRVLFGVHNLWFLIVGVLSLFVVCCWLFVVVSVVGWVFDCCQTDTHLLHLLSGELDLKTGLKKTKILELTGDNNNDETIILSLKLIHVVSKMNGIDQVVSFDSYLKRWINDEQKDLKQLWDDFN